MGGLGAGNAGVGWFLDDLRPTRTVSLPRAGDNPDPLTLIRFGMADNYSGLDLPTLSVTSDLPIAGRPAGAELADGCFSGSVEVPAGVMSEEIEHRCNLRRGECCALLLTDAAQSTDRNRLEIPQRQGRVTGRHPCSYSSPK